MILFLEKPKELYFASEGGVFERLYPVTEVSLSYDFL